MYHADYIFYQLTSSKASYYEKLWGFAHELRPTLLGILGIVMSAAPFGSEGGNSYVSPLLHITLDFKFATLVNDGFRLPPHLAESPPLAALGELQAAASTFLTTLSLTPEPQPPATRPAGSSNPLGRHLRLYP